MRRGGGLHGRGVAICHDQQDIVSICLFVCTFVCQFLGFDNIKQILGAYL